MKEHNRAVSAPQRNANMSRKREEPAKPPEVKTEAAEQPTEGEAKRDVPKHRQCPCCYNGLGGVGKEKWWRRINGALVRRAYKCDRCPYNWTVEVRTHSVIESIEYRDVRLETRDQDGDEGLGGVPVKR